MTRLARFFTNRYVVAFLWFGLSLFAVIKQAARHNINNYLIYKYTFINLVSRINLYIPQPEHFADTNHYGPLFALVISPFTLLPDGVAAVLWVMVNTAFLYYVIQQLPFSLPQRTIIILLCAHELMTASYNVQFNPSMAALIVWSYLLISKKQDFWAAFVIVLGTFIKLYGIVGLAFFFFSRQKGKFTLSVLFWGIALFLLPMLFSSPAFVIESYVDWYHSLTEKNMANATSTMQDICVMGMIRRIFSYPAFKDAWVLLIAVLVFLSSYIRIKDFQNRSYQLLILASTLIFTVIFSTGSESPTYIIAFTGVAIWYQNLQRPVARFEVFLLVFALVLTSFSPSDLFPQYINKHYVKPYALKALPCFIIWLKIVYESWTRKFGDSNAQVALT
ncbi:glycosyltransferase family 87 protein [Mucilaginibacter koreensis]